MSEPDHEPLPEGEEAAPPWVRGMAVVRWVLIGLMAVAAAGTWLYFLDALPHAAARAGARFHCPMHPAVVMDHRGECPICGMDLVPLEPHAPPASQPASAPAGAPVPGVVPVMLSAERARLGGLRTAPVVRDRTAPELRTVGFVAPNEQGLARIHPRFAGWIEDLLVTRTGHRVRRGEVLATVYSPELLAAQQDFLNLVKWQAAAGGAALATGPGTARLVDDARHRLELLGVAREEIDEVARTGRPLRALKVRATVAGHVTQKTAVRGLYVQPATELFQVADLSTVWVLADVYEYEVSRVHVGDAARLVVSAHPGETFAGKVRFIYPTLNADTRTLRVRLEFRNPALKLKPGFSGTVVLDLPARAGLAIPPEAVIDTGAVAYVYVARPGNTYEPRRVRLGPRTESRVQVLEGLAAGDAVVTAGNFALDAEARLRAAIERPAPPGPAPAHQH